MAQYANNYGARPNPYDQRGGNGTSPGYGSPEFRQTTQYGEHTSMGRDDYGQNVELAPLAKNGQQFGAAADNAKDTLDQCNLISNAVDDIEKYELPGLKSAQQASLNSADPARAAADVDARSQTIMQTYRGLVNQVRILKSNRLNQNPNDMRGRQVKRIDEKLKSAMHAYQVVDNDFSKKLKEQIARQYRIVRPDATEQEVRQAIESNDQQVFSQALMQSDRRGQSQSTLNAVKSRHVEIQKIARQMEELAELFQDMDTLVVQQEAAVTNIEMKGEEVVDNMDNGTKQIGVAVQSARNARKWKWWCLGLSILIIIIIVVVVLIVLKPWNNNSNSTTAKPAKRFALPLEVRRVISEYTPDVERAVIPGQPYVPISKRFRKFQS